MLYAVAVLAGICAGVFAKGRLSNLITIRFEKKWLILLAFAVQALTQVLGVNGVKWVSEYSVIIQIAVYFLFIAALWVNRHYKGILVIGLGCALNVLVMMVNGGRMPVDEGLLAASDQVLFERLMNDGKHVAKGAATNLAFLGDIIPMPGILGYGTRIVSIGDIITAAGVFYLVFEVMRGKKQDSDDFANKLEV